MTRHDKAQIGGGAVKAGHRTKDRVRLQGFHVREAEVRLPFVEVERDIQGDPFDILLGHRVHGNRLARIIQARCGGCAEIVRRNNVLAIALNGSRVIGQIIEERVGDIVCVFIADRTNCPA